MKYRSALSVKSPETWSEFRTPRNGIKRSADEVPFVELVALARQIASRGFTDAEAIREMARRLGFSTLRGANRVRATKALTKAKGDGSG